MTTVHILRDNISLSHSAGTTNEIVVVPGECVTAHEGLLRGHGTYVENGDLVASVAGAVQRVNKLVTVRPLNSRYSGEIGDVVIGRISEVGAKRWKVDVNSYQDAVLMLSSVILPGGQQRRRTYEDQLQMRDVFVEGELLSAEVQNFFADGAISLHTRSLKYGKLENGQLLTVPTSLIKRLKKHNVKLPGIDVQVTIGCNGYIWITKVNKLDASGDGGAGGGAAHRRIFTAEDTEAARKEHSELIIDPECRVRISRVANAVTVLSRGMAEINISSLMCVYTASLKFNMEPKKMLEGKNVKKLLLHMHNNRDLSIIETGDKMNIT